MATTPKLNVNFAAFQDGLKAQFVGLNRQARLLHVLRQTDALDGKRCLIGQGVEETSLIGGQ